MRCVIVQNRLGLEGRTRCVAEFVRLLNEIGEEPQIVCLTYDDPDIGKAFGMSDLRYQLVPLQPWSRIPSAHRPEVLITNFLARRVIDRLKPELVINSNDTWAFLPAGPRYIHYIHFPFKPSLHYMPRFSGGFWKSYASFVDLLVREKAPPPHSTFVTNSEFVRARFSEMYALDATVIHPPAWNGELHAGRTDLRRVVTLGSFHADKGQMEQLAIARLLPDWHFTLLGSAAAPRYARKVQRAASEMPNVSVVLNPTRRQIDDEFARASHFVHTNPHEGFGIAAVEAAAAGCIPVVPDTGGLREIVEADTLRFRDIDGCVKALRASTGEAGGQLLTSVQQGLPRFGADAFRAALTDVVIAGPEMVTSAAALPRLEPVPGAAQPKAEKQTSFLSGSALLFWAQVASATGFFVAVLLLARGLGPDGRGTMAFISVAALIIGRTARLGVAEAAAIFAAQRQSVRAALLADIAVFIVPASFVVASAVAVGLMLMPDPRPAGVNVIELIALVPGAVGIAITDGCGLFLSGCKRFVARAITNATAPWIYAMILAVLTSTVGLTVPRAAIGWAVAMSIGGIVTILVSVRSTGLARPDRPLLAQLIRLGSRLWIGTLTSFLNLRVDQVLMGFISTKATLGIYAVAVNAAEVLLYFPTAIGEALFPFLAVGQPREQARVALRVARLLALTTTASIAVAALLGPELIPVVFGAPFGPSVIPFLWLLPGALGYAATRVFSSALATSSTPGRFSLPPIISLIVSIVLDILLIPTLGASGAAIAASAAYITGGVSALLLHRSLNPFAARELLPRVEEVTILVPRARAALGRLRSR